ncbi:MAG: hypothetical protein E7389_06205 [Ruminococcaceae bacterium]|nr:hypothetical protein [Oscillospiraceae bacterium]
MAEGISFDEYGICGKVGSEITPEKMAVLGRSICTVLGSKIALGTDNGSGSEMVKNAVLSGILSGGGTVLDFGGLPLAILRSGIKFYNLRGGVHISSDGQRINILSSNGINPDLATMTEIMQSFSSGKAEKVSHEGIREIISLKSYKLYYIRDIINNCKNEKLGFNLLICSKSSAASSVIIPLLDETGCKYTIYKSDKPSIGNEFAQVVKNEGYDLGAYIDESGEKLTLCDKNGNVFSDEMYDCLAAVIVFRTEPDKTFVAPMDASSAIEKIAEIYGGKIIRTKSSKNIIMSKISELDKDKLSSQFILKFDPACSIIKILDFLKTEKTSLEEIAALIPTFYMLKSSEACRDSQKIIEQISKKHKNIDTTEGVKIFEENGWALLSPLKDKVRIVCEGTSMEAANELMAKYTDIVRNIIK